VEKSSRLHRPANGRFTRTSRPTALVTDGLMVSVRPSDELAPTWGGEVMLRIDVVAAPLGARAALDVAIVLDGEGGDALALVGAALGQLGSDDRVMVVDARGAHVVVPWLPGNHRSLALAAVERRLTHDPHRGTKGSSLARALQVASNGSDPNSMRRVVLLTDGKSIDALGSHSYPPPIGQSPPLLVSTSTEAPLDSLIYVGHQLGATVAVDSDPGVRADAVRGYVPAPGPVAYRNLVVKFEGSPGPSHLLEASGGTVLPAIEADQLVLGEVRAGESRTEVARLTMPSWTATLPFRLELSVQFDNARQGDIGRWKRCCSCRTTRTLCGSHRRDAEMCSRTHLRLRG